MVSKLFSGFLTLLISLLAVSASCQELAESAGIRFRLIPGGSYLLGSAPDEPGRYDNELPPHRVALKPFYLSVTDVTNEQYGKFLRDAGRRPPLYWQDKNLNAPAQPVVGVTWYDAVAFTQWLSRLTGTSHRLPTEAEWEAAARGGLEGQPYPWGREAPNAGHHFRANYYPNALSTPVGSFPPNGFGLYDMAGNVSQWCLDEVPAGPARNPFADWELRVLKGGSWYSRARDLRCAARQLLPPHTADGFIGFRIRRSAPQTP